MEEYEEDKKAYDWTIEPDANAGGIGDNDADSYVRGHLETQDAFDNLREPIARAQENLTVRAHPEKFPVPVQVPHEPLIRPAGDAAQLLEHQIASCAALMGYLAHFVARPDTDPATCNSFMDRMSSMLGASAQIGKVVGRLRGNISETRQLITVEKKTTGGGVGEGCWNLENNDQDFAARRGVATKAGRAARQPQRLQDRMLCERAARPAQRDRRVETRDAGVAGVGRQIASPLWGGRQS
jgi:hypothetical protein